MDIGALTIAGIGVIIAIAAKQPIISLSGVIIADVSGVVLTVKKAYLHPGSETTISWLLVGTASLFGVLAVGQWSFGILLYPFYLMLANYSIPIAQFAGTKMRKNNHSSRSNI